MPKEESEEYLEAMLDLSRDGEPVKTTELARRLGVAPPSVTEAVQRLSREGMVAYRPYRGVTLSEKGRAAARRLKRKHRLLEVFLTRVLRMNRQSAHDEACRLEHALSDEAGDALCRSLRGPRSCPDGDAIPPCRLYVDSCATCIREGVSAGKRTENEAQPLTSLPENATAKVVFVHGGKGVVKRLCEMGLTPGTPVRLLRAAPMKGPIEVRVRGCDLALGRGIADKIFVEPGDAHT
jgi:DtxR family Mn-dependent transcriptional regulator